MGTYARLIENESLYLPDLVRDTGGFLEDVHFKRCRLRGPAVLALTDVTARFLGDFVMIIPPGSQDDFLDNPDWFFWHHDISRPFIGAIGIRNCCFEDCEFDGIAWAGDERMRQWLHQSFPLGRCDAELSKSFHPDSLRNRKRAPANGSSPG